MSQISAIFFDLDGTIVDTEPAAMRTLKREFAKWGLNIEEKDAQYVTGRTWDDAFRYLFSRYELPVSKDQAADQIIKEYSASIKEALPVVPGVLESIRDLSEEYPLALVSGSYRSDIIFALDHLKVRDCFEVILGAEDYPRGKPAPDGYQKAMEIISVSPKQALVFEDSSVGVRSGRAAGAWVTAVLAANHLGEDVGLAHFTISDFTKVDRAWVRSLDLSQ